MVTKRTILGIQQRVDSAIGQIQSLARRSAVCQGSVIAPNDLMEILERDLGPAKEDLEYAFQMAD